MPQAYKEAGDWVIAKPADAVPKGKWWEVFGDPVLNSLMEQVSVTNQTLAAAQARYTASRSSVQLLGRRLAATVALIRALGGAW